MKNIKSVAAGKNLLHSYWPALKNSTKLEDFLNFVRKINFLPKKKQPPIKINLSIYSKTKPTRLLIQKPLFLNTKKNLNQTLMKKAKKESETISKNCLHKTSALISLNLKISTKSTIIRITDTTFLSKKKKKPILIYSLTNPQTFFFFL